ncbi:MAG: phosphatidylinositol-specific phospholipase C/glycerophosphodiester phosphodiesterase family protein [Pseudomonadota bacterium]
MQIILHRLNTVDALQAAPEQYGVEVDIRSRGQDLIIHHDPFAEGEAFERWIAAYDHKTLILNVKEEGLEDRLLAQMAKHGINDFFFLDQSFPFLRRTAARGERRCAVRVSEYESVETALALAGQVDWVWVDCFTRWPLTRDDTRRLKTAGFRLCAVSPELQGRDAELEIPAYRAMIDQLGVELDAVCTKRADLWGGA